MKDYSKRLSVIVPGYNTPKEWWMRCVASLQNALGPDDEIILVDDGSREMVSSLLNSKVSNSATAIKIIRHEMNLGLPSARNTGLDMAQGRFVTFVDSDDEVVEEVYTRCLSRMEETGADLAVFGVQSIYPDFNLTSFDIPEDRFYGMLTPRDVASLVKQRLFYYSWNKVFRRKFIDEHQMRFDPRGVPCEDAIFNVTCVINKAKWMTVGCCGYKYYRYDGSLLSSYKPTLIDGQRACTKVWHDYKMSTPNAVEQMDEFGLGWYDERSEQEILKNEWANIWRRRTPYSVVDRWQWLKKNYQMMSGHSVPVSAAHLFIVFLQKAVIMWVRAHLYVKPLRRWHQIRFSKQIGAKFEKWEGGV